MFFVRSSVDAVMKPTLLLIHGFPGASWDYSLLWRSLSARFNVIAPDLIGYGFSAKPQNYDYRIFDQADLCEALLQRLQVTGYHLLAHDVGDTVAQELLARAKDGTATLNLKSVSFLNGGLFPETHRTRFVQQLLLSPVGRIVAKRITRASFAANMTQIFGVNTLPSTRQLDVMWALATENDGLAVMHLLIYYICERRRYRERWVDALIHAGGGITRRAIPIQLIIGTDDPISGRHMADRYRQLIPEANIMLLNGIGHYPQLEAPDLVLRGFFDFFESIHLT